MNSDAELTALYQQWRTLTEEEGRAIAAGAWTNVEHCQNAKSRLQLRIIEVSRRRDPEAYDCQLKPILKELMELEHRNSDLLREKRKTADRARETLEQSSRQLRQLHKSYVPPAKVLWQSYS